MWDSNQEGRERKKGQQELDFCDLARTGVFCRHGMESCKSIFFKGPNPKCAHCGLKGIFFTKLLTLITQMSTFPFWSNAAVWNFEYNSAHKPLHTMTQLSAINMDIFQFFKITYFGWPLFQDGHIFKIAYFGWPLFQDGHIFKIDNKSTHSLLSTQFTQ